MKSKWQKKIEHGAFYSYLIRISDKLDIDLIAAANAKIELNADKYAVDKARGSSKKYTALLRGIRARHQARV